MLRTQISVDPATYRRARQAARRQGISLAELTRRGLDELIAREPASQPWMAWAGTVAGAEGDSLSVDEVVYGRAEP